MRHALILTTAICLSAPALADHDDMIYRILAADAEAGQLHILDTDGEAAPITLDLSSPGRVYMGPDGRHAWVVQRDAGMVQVVDTGLIEEDHGDHSALFFEAPALLPATASGERPVHFNMDAETVAIFWDGAGAATLHDVGNAIAGELTPATVFETGAPHHGVAVPVGAHTILTVAPEGQGLPDALAVVDADGAELSRLACLNFHGEGKAANFIAFGCEDGVAIYDTSTVPPTGRFVAYPEDAPDGGMLRTLLSPRDTLALVGNFGAAHLAIFDPSSETGDFTFVDLPAARMAFALDDSGMEGFALLADGRLLRFSALTGRVLGETQAVTGAYSMERGVIRPMMDVAANRIAITDPAAGQVVLVHTETLEVTDRIAAGPMPRSVLLLAAEAAHVH